MHPTALKDRIILVTRPQPEADTTASLIRRAGGTPLISPMLSIQPAEDPRPFQNAIQSLDQFDGVLITSANGARAYLEELAIQEQVVSHTPPCYSVGPKTATLLREGGLQVTQPNSRFDGEALAQAINEWQGAQRRFLFPRAAIGRETLIDGLAEEGHHITTVAAYEAVPAQRLSDQALKLLREERVDAALFFSSRTATTFFELMMQQAIMPDNMVLGALSPVTGEKMAALGFAAQVIPQQATAEHLLTALADYWDRPTF
ncbi:uroporphyrinogen-III synthase [Magnetococcus sp. PR-3]|uniref:uroporphyrinogen-III synthase n=1 Tax=Magnetococcus sp. PR-3 TaxID=3120355 RepID=UPI002FCE4F8D